MEYPSRETLLDRLEIDVESGKCWWKKPPMNHPYLLGMEAGGLHVLGYHHIRVGGKPIKRGYIVFFIVNGRWPKLLDHKDRNRSNDAISNLREATKQENNFNHGGRKKKQPTPMGVSLMASGRYRAKIRINRKDICLGTFPTVEDAHSAYLSKRKELFGAFCGC